MPTIEAIFLRDALDALAAGGGDVAAVLSAVGIERPDVEKPDYAISAEQYGRVWLAISEVLGCEYFGLGARPLPPGSFAMLCRTVAAGPTLEAVLRRALKFLNLMMKDPRGTLAIADGRATVTLAEEHGPRSAFAYRTFFLIIYGVACWSTRRRLDVEDVGFRCAPTRANPADKDFFGATVRFGCIASSMSFDADALSLPVDRDEAALQRFLKGAPANLLVRYKYEGGLANTVRGVLKARPPTQWPRFDELAARLRMSEPNLRRRLRAEGESYAAIREEIRRTLAMKWLLQPERSVGSISADLGYAEPSAFHRAFRKWADTSPGKHRQRALQPPSQ